MARRVRVSSQGFTNCPSCDRHIKVEDEIAETECPFCGIALRVSKADSMGARLMSLGRGAVVASALLGAASMGAVGCTDDEEEPAPASDVGDETEADVPMIREDVPDPFNNGNSDYAAAAIDEEEVAADKPG